MDTVQAEESRGFWPVYTKEENSLQSQIMDKEHQICGSDADAQARDQQG